MSDLLRLNKLFVTRQYEDDGTLVLETKSKNPKVPKRCCLLQPLDKNGTKRQRYRDHPVQGQPAMLEVLRQRFRCFFCGTTHYEELPDVDGDRRITARFRTYLEDQAIRLPFTQVAALNGLHETLIRRLFEERAERDLAGYQPPLPRVLGMVEIYLHKRARSSLRSTPYDEEPKNLTGNACSWRKSNGQRWRSRFLARARPDRWRIRRPEGSGRAGC